jgi:hypothetical protein
MNYSLQTFSIESIRCLFSLTSYSIPGNKSDVIAWNKGISFIVNFGIFTSNKTYSKSLSSDTLDFIL